MTKVINSMLERIARAMADADGEDNEGWGDLYLTRARAAVEALMEPDEAVVHAGERARNTAATAQTAASYRAMLQTILHNHSNTRGE